MTKGLNDELSFTLLLDVRRKPLSMLQFDIPQINKIIETGIIYHNHITIIAVILAPRIRYYYVGTEYNLNSELSLHGWDLNIQRCITFISIESPDGVYISVIWSLLNEQWKYACHFTQCFQHWSGAKWYLPHNYDEIIPNVHGQYHACWRHNARGS